MPALPAMPSIWRAPAVTIPSEEPVQAREHPCGQSLPSSLTRPLSHVASLAERFRTLLPLIPHVANATMAQPQVRSASLQSQAPQRRQQQLRVRSRPSPPLRSYPVRPQRTRSRVPMTRRCIMLHGCPPSPDAWGRLNVVTPFHHLSGDSHINSSLREGPLRHLVNDRAQARPRIGRIEYLELLNDGLNGERVTPSPAA